MIDDLHIRTHGKRSIGGNLGLWRTNMLFSEQELTVQIGDINCIEINL
jgi:hypothetical protein